jgi:hypothetical protein
MPFFVHQTISFPVPLSQDITSHHFTVCTFMLHLEGWAHKAWEPSNKWCSVSPKIVSFHFFHEFYFSTTRLLLLLNLSVLLQRQKGSSSWFEVSKSTELIARTSVIPVDLTAVHLFKKTPANYLNRRIITFTITFPRTVHEPTETYHPTATVSNGYRLFPSFFLFIIRNVFFQNILRLLITSLL